MVYAQCFIQHIESGSKQYKLLGIRVHNKNTIFL